MREDIQVNGGPLSSSKFLTEEEIQRVIFDKQYLKYLKKKVKEELANQQL